MNTLRVLASPRVWGPVLGVVAVHALVFYAYLGAVVSPEENLKDLPIALVNDDRGGGLAGKDVNLGDRVVEKITAPDSPAAGTVDWNRPDTRDEAKKGIGNGEHYGATVIPKDYSQRLASLSGPPESVLPSGEPPAPEPGGQAFYHGPNRDRLHRHHRRDLGRDERAHTGRPLGRGRARATGSRGGDLRPREGQSLRGRGLR
jgi:YhgE/Pip-like protein